MKAQDSLLPCPFCGGDARRSTGGNGADAWFGSGCDADQSCPAHLRALMHRTQDEADSAWNRRALLTHFEQSKARAKSKNKNQVHP